MLIVIAACVEWPRSKRLKGRLSLRCDAHFSWAQHETARKREIELKAPKKDSVFEVGADPGRHFGGNGAASFEPSSEDKRKVRVMPD